MAWIVTAVTSIGAAFAAGAAVVGGAALTAATITTIAVGVANAGVILSVVGKVTKSPELMKIGKVMSIAGGITAIGSSLVGSMSSAGGAALEGGASNVIPTSSSAVADSGVNQAVGEVASSAQTFGIDNPGLNLDATSPFSASSIPSAPTNTSLSSSLNPESIQLGSTPQASTPLGSTPQASLDPNTANAAQNVQSASLTAAPKPGFMQGVSDWWDSLDPKDKSRYVDGLLQTGGKAVGALYEGWSEDKKRELEQKVLDEKKRQYDTTMTNASSIPTVVFKPRLNGLVNGARGPGG